MANSQIEVSFMVVNTNKNQNCNLRYRQREKEIVKFFNVLSPKPDVCLLQEAYIWKNSRNNQIRDVTKTFTKKGRWFWAWSREYSTDYFEKFNAIIYNQSSSPVCEPNSLYLGDLPARFCVVKLNIKGETVLVVSFHGFYKRTIADRELNLRRFLNFFCTVKQNSGSSHLIVGGDFNVDLDRFGQGNNQFLKNLNLKIVSYRKQRNGGKIDGLICDKGIDVKGVTVFAENDCQAKLVGKTKVVRSSLSRHTLDHQPLLFQLGLPVR